MPVARSSFELPSKVEYTSAVPAGFSLVTNASAHEQMFEQVPCSGLLIGKSMEVVNPVT